MKQKKTISVLFLLMSGVGNIFSQTFDHPNTGLKSPETLEISKIEATSEKTVVFLTLENRITGGYFCADKNIIIVYPDGTRLKMTNSNGIPQCPDTYKFRSIGEKLSFVLTFPSLKPGTTWIDIIEDCSDNCFSFYGVTLDEILNRKLDEAYSFAAMGETYKALSVYRSILDSINGTNPGITGALYTEIITLAVSTGDTSAGKTLYRQMLSSKAPRLDLYIKNLNARGIKY